MTASLRLGSTHNTIPVMSDCMEGLGSIEEAVCSCAEQAKAPGSEPAPVAAEAPMPSQMLNGVAGEAATSAPDAVPAEASLGDAPPNSRENEETAEEAQGLSGSPSAAEAPAPTQPVQSAPEVRASVYFTVLSSTLGLYGRCARVLNALTEKRMVFAGKHGAERARCRAAGFNAAAGAGRAYGDAELSEHGSSAAAGRARGWGCAWVGWGAGTAAATHRSGRSPVGAPADSGAHQHGPDEAARALR